MGAFTRQRRPSGRSGAEDPQTGKRRLRRALTPFPGSRLLCDFLCHVLLGKDLGSSTGKVRSQPRAPLFHRRFCYVTDFIPRRRRPWFPLRPALARSDQGTAPLLFPVTPLSVRRCPTTASSTCFCRQAQSSSHAVAKGTPSEAL